MSATVTTMVEEPKQILSTSCPSECLFGWLYDRTEKDRYIAKDGRACPDIAVKNYEYSIYTHQYVAIVLLFIRQSLAALILLFCYHQNK